MAWTTPGTAVAGNVLTSALWNSDVRDNSLMGNPVFTNEAARDAAIPSPSEGQRVYLTSPTVPAATGETTQLPSGITTVYNGSAWVCVTPVSARSNDDGTTTSTTYTATLTNGGTNVSVTLSTGTTALVMMSAYILSPAAGTFALVGLAVSGASTIAAGATNEVTQSTGQYVHLTRTYVYTGLTAGTNTFTMNYRVTPSGTMTVVNRDLTVVGIA